MKTTSKIHLSPQEMELVTRADWLLNKHIIIKKVFEMFGAVNEIFKKEAEPYHKLFPENIKYHNGKISRGENYKLLPYAILDYPSFFWKERVFAVRSMFWWGNFFSITLHLSGSHKEKYINNSETIFSFLQKNNFFICINEDEWQHHFGADNYILSTSINQADFEKINEKNFFKIAKHIPLSQWENANEFLLNSFKEIMEILKINSPNDKKDLLPGFPKVGSDL
jgi:hypothetical protein